MNSDLSAKPDPLAYLLDELDDATARDFATRLREDTTEAQDFAELEDAWLSLALLAPQQEPPPGGFNGVLAQLPEDGRGSAWQPMLYALGGLAAGLALMWLTSSDNEPETDAAPAVAVSTVAGESTAGSAQSSGSETDTAPPVTLTAAQQEQALTLLLLTEENESLRELVSQYRAEQARLDQQLRAQAQRWAQYFNKDTGISRWSVLSLSAAQDAESTATASSLSGRLNQLASTDPGLRLASVDGSGGFTSASSFDPVTVDANGNPVADTGQSETQSDAQVAPSALVLWDASGQEGVLAVSGLSSAPEGYDYQMWIDDGVHVRNAGLLPAFEQGTGQAVFNLESTQADIGSVFITVEPKGGSTTPGGSVVLRGPVAGEATP